MTLRTKIEEAIGERHVHKIDNSELLDQICTIFKEELEKLTPHYPTYQDGHGRLAKMIDSLINSLNEGKGE